jgi:hypothetical protein
MKPNLPETIALVLGMLVTLVAAGMSLDSGGNADATQAIKFGVVALALIGISRELRERRKG